MKTFVVVRDEEALSTVLCLEVEGNNEGEAFHEALLRYPDPNRYSAATLYGRDWDSLRISYPRYADARPELYVPQT